TLILAVVKIVVGQSADSRGREDRRGTKRALYRRFQPRRSSRLARSASSHTTIFTTRRLRRSRLHDPQAASTDTTIFTTAEPCARHRHRHHPKANSFEAPPGGREPVGAVAEGLRGNDLIEDVLRLAGQTVLVQSAGTDRQPPLVLVVEQGHHVLESLLLVLLDPSRRTFDDQV